MMIQKSLFKRVLSTICVASMLMLSGCEDYPGYISDAVISPDGSYQAEVVQISYGATGGESCIYLERADNGDFPVSGDQTTENSLRIDETQSGWSTEYSIEWISEDTFTVISGTRYFNYYRVTLNDSGYGLTRGLELDEDKCVFSERIITGNTIEIPVRIYVQNHIGDTVYFTAKAYVTTGGYPLSYINATTDRDSKSGELLKLGPYEEGYFDIVLTGEKDSDVNFKEDVDDVYVHIIRIGEE